MGTCRVIIEPEACSGVRNMALDEALLEAALERGICTVRWYRWETATVSLGYFQEADAVALSPELAGCPVVRRLTGGGAIVHHHEWTYSCAVPSNHPLAAEPGRLYGLVHERIIVALAECGIEATLRGAASTGSNVAFLCFGRGDARDVVLRGHKIVGSAQRRRKGAVLQHGSVLLRRSQFAPQFTGALELAGLAEIGGDFPRRAGELCGSLFGSIAIATEHEQPDVERCVELERRYRTLDWGRSKPATGHTYPSFSA
jgi:lipoyl(octanoyl) transferase